MSFIFRALKIFLYFQKNSFRFDKYLNCFIRKHTLLRVSVRENYHLQGIYTQAYYSFGHVKHIGLESKYRMTETYEYAC